MRKLKLIKVAFAFAPLIFALPFALAENEGYVGEDYYGNNIDAAVLEANQNKRELNYNTKHWYKRTTSKSFKLNPLEKNDLEIERLEGAFGATSSGGRTITTNPEFPAKEQSEQIQKDHLQNISENESTTPTHNTADEFIKEPTSIPSPKVSHHFPRGDIVTTSGIITTGTVVSTPRP